MLVLIGDLIDDVVVIGAHAIERGTDNPARISHTRGGSAANVAAAAAALVPTRFIGRVGTDATGEALASQLAKAGVDVRVQREGRTGSIVILVDETGERTMLTDRGAAAELGPIDPAWLEGASWVHLPLYGLTDRPSRIAILGALARLPGVPRSIDLSSVATMRHLGGEMLDDLLSRLHPDVVFANADEDSLARDLGLALPAATTLVVKNGADPVRLGTGGESIDIPVPPVGEVVDTTGAGDAFAAGYLAAALDNAPAPDCVRAGVALAAQALAHPGAL